MPEILERKTDFGWVQFAAFLASFIFSLIPLWMSLPLVALLLKARGYEEDVIGVFSAMPWVGLTLVSPLVPKIILHIGLNHALAIGTVLGSVALLSFCIADSLPLWFALNFVQGMALAIRWVAADAWVNAAVPESKRGRITGIYDMLTGGAVGFGPTILLFAGTSTTDPLLIGSAMGLVALGPLCVAWTAAPKLIDAPPGLRLSTCRILRSEPAAFLALILAGFAEATSLALLPLYGLSHDLGDRLATLLITITQGGVLTGSLIFGLLADRIDRNKLLLGSVAISALIPAFFPAVISHFAQWPTLFIWGIGQGGAFVVGMIILGSRFVSSGLAEAMTLAMIAYTIGGLIGPSIAGLAVVRLGPDAQPFTLSIFGGLVFAASMYIQAARSIRSRRRA